jgi:23S rRNA-/tRNA-specific pseudouridylate synthase
VEYPIGPHPSREKGYREKYVVRHDELGKHAVTIVRVRERYRIPEGVSARVDSAPGGAGAYSLVELELKTGRTHQIRVHLSHLGYPIVGDDMYGGKAFTDETGREVIARQSLHACTLGIRHPVSDKPLEFTAPLRGDIAGLVQTLRRLSAAVDRPEAPGATVDLAKAVGE